MKTGLPWGGCVCGPLRTGRTGRAQARSVLRRHQRCGGGRSALVDIIGCMGIQELVFLQSFVQIEESSGGVRFPVVSNKKRSKFTEQRVATN